MTRVHPVRRGRGPVHLGAATGRGYTTVCRRTLTGVNVELTHRGWWFGTRCAICDRMLRQAKSSRARTPLAVR